MDILLKHCLHLLLLLFPQCNNVIPKDLSQYLLWLPLLIMIILQLDMEELVKMQHYHHHDLPILLNMIIQFVGILVVFMMGHLFYLYLLEMKKKDVEESYKIGKICLEDHLLHLITLLVEKKRNYV